MLQRVEALEDETIRRGLIDLDQPTQIDFSLAFILTDAKVDYAHDPANSWRFTHQSEAFRRWKRLSN